MALAVATEGDGCRNQGSEQEHLDENVYKLTENKVVATSGEVPPGGVESDENARNDDGDAERRADDAKLAMGKEAALLNE